MHREYFVAYDIRDPTRLRRVHKLMKGYGDGWQYSVFNCILKDIDRVRMQTDLESQINNKVDTVIIIDLGPRKRKNRKDVTIIGQPPSEPLEGTVII